MSSPMPLPTTAPARALLLSLGALFMLPLGCLDLKIGGTNEPVLAKDGGECKVDSDCKSGACIGEACAGTHGCNGESDCEEGWSCYSSNSAWSGSGSLCLRSCGADSDLGPCPLGEWCDAPEGGSCLIGSSTPYLSVTGPFTAHPGEDVFFSAEVGSGSGVVDSYDWSWGDGATSSGQEVDHVWTAPGTYPLSLVVKDANGLTADEQWTFQVCLAANQACTPDGDECCSWCAVYEDGSARCD